TWGDRNRDAHIGEAFTLRELEAAQRLGITHFQIDDGWQTGRSANSALSQGTLTGIWKNLSYWKPDPVKFPKGLSPVIALGKKLGIQVCLWFNPSKDSSYAHWVDDARTLIYLYEKEGIRTFKIDGVEVNDKAGEVNLRKMFDTVMDATHNEVVFNLDATAGKRYGYHYFNEYGNIFLENRYTDAGSYYPYWTLRNLWMLSRYVPAQNLQIEFLNNFRNADKYPKDDILAPSKVSFEYEFALTMMAQPLAWMEATGLPEQAFSAAPAIKKYQSIQSRIHAGQIFPIGNEPSGLTWTGFQSINGKKGYILVIREYNQQSTAQLKTWLGSKQKIQLKAIIGAGKDMITTTDSNGSISFRLDKPNSYALYEYQVL
ncbi:MAG TPA: alpha-galactosidase, partial [Sphingobacteriaceae bacterium]|nr:alpha-galactosidase [Sphingobacteriaceae bacterium]